MLHHQWRSEDVERYGARSHLKYGCNRILGIPQNIVHSEQMHQKSNNTLSVFFYRLKHAEPSKIWYLMNPYHSISKRCMPEILECSLLLLLLTQLHLSFVLASAYNTAIKFLVQIIWAVLILQICWIDTGPEIGDLICHTKVSCDVILILKHCTEAVFEYHVHDVTAEELALLPNTYNLPKLGWA